MSSTAFQAPDPQFEQRVRESFARQAAMATIGARLCSVEAGRVVIELPFAPHITQQHGFIHGGIMSAALDSACGYAGFSLMAADAAVLTIEFKINLLAPAKGQRFRMVGTVLKPGYAAVVTYAMANIITRLPHS